MPPASPEGVAVILPAYGLEPAIRANVHRVALALADVRPLHIVVSDDGSQDGTLAEAEGAAAELRDLAGIRVEVVSTAVNQGKGAALARGFAASRGDVVVFLDGDLDLPPEQVPELITRLEAERADVLVGAKHHPAAVGRLPWKRRILSRVFSLVARVLFRLPVRETQTGLKVFRRPVLDDVLGSLEVHRYAFDLELLVKAHRAGYRMIEVPVTLAPTASSRPFRARMLWEMARDTLRIWWRSLRRRPR